MLSRRNIIIISTPIVIVGLLYLYLTYIRTKVKNLATGTDQASRNVQAFLMMIRKCEGTSGNDGYRTVFGGGLISNLADHPYNTGEWKGKTLSDTMCKNAGLGPGCKSTAAGAYQFIKPTWNGLKLKLALPDFSAASQDQAAIELIRSKNALTDIEFGRVKEAINKVRTIWASLPGAGYGQPEKSLLTAISYYSAAGGQMA